jgi:hypothetical protein
MLTLDDAATLLGLPESAVKSLVASGFLAPTGPAECDWAFQLSDVKAFLARNADNGAGAGLLDRALAMASNQSGDTDLEPGELIGLLDARAEQMAYRVFKIFSTVFPEAGTWPLPKQGEFVQQAKGRFEAILAVTEAGADVDDSLFDDLHRIGASAARTGTPLLQLLVLLRMSRDLVVQNAVELAETAGRHGGFALSLLLTRILPAMDRLSDALAQGYWEAGAA